MRQWRFRAHSVMTAGFTLIEVMTAITLLMVIILMMASMFSQFRFSWRSGMLRTARNSEARAILNFMEKELASAVANSGLPCNIADDGATCGFFRYGNPDQAYDASGDRAQRAISYVEYTFAGSTLRRSESFLDLSDSFPPGAAPSGGSSEALLEKIEDVRFFTSSGTTHTTNLPRWVEIELQAAPQQRAISRISVWSLGRDGKDGSESQRRDDVPREHP